ncbi:MAG: lipid-A-disaccharide synthase [Magnetococcus sp. WYHC-3]
MVVAGEASGDDLGAELLATLRQRLPDLEVFGAGGSGMVAQGLVAHFGVNDLSVIGLAEVLRRLPRLLAVFRHLVALMERQRPDLLLTIDLPDFNFLLAAQARRRGIPVVHYVCPQVWAWRAGRTRRIAQLVDRLLVLFPFEREVFQGTGLPVNFVGHPLVTRTAALPPPGEVRRAWGIAEGVSVLALLPGSRHGEVRRLLPVFVATAARVRAERPGLRCLLALAPTLTLADLKAALGTPWPEWLEVREDGAGQVLSAAHCALVASGTATLEAALVGVPLVVAYRVHPLTYAIGRRVVRVPFISLANLVAGRAMVRERIQDKAREELLGADVLELLNDAPGSAALREELLGLRQRLQTPEQSAAHWVEWHLRQSREGQAASAPIP